jgi:hypothetical protein
MKIGDAIEYVRKDGTVHEAVVMRSERLPGSGVLETVWFKHPEKPGEVKYIHDVPRQSAEHLVRCWRPREGS